MREIDTRTRNRLLLLGLVLLLTIPLTLALRDVVREGVLIPLLYVVWFGSLAFNAVPQVFFWAILLIVVLVLAVTSLVRRKQPVQGEHRVNPGNPGQVHVWARRIHLMERGDFSRWYVAQHLRRLILDVLAYHERLDFEQVKRYLRTGDLEVSLEVGVCLQVGLAPEYSKSRGILFRLWRRLRPSTQASPDLDLESVVQFLEDRLEAEA